MGRIAGEPDYFNALIFWAIGVRPAGDSLRFGANGFAVPSRFFK
jgi:hypothetical protein